MYRALFLHLSAPYDVSDGLDQLPLTPFIRCTYQSQREWQRLILLAVFGAEYEPHYVSKRQFVCNFDMVEKNF